ncbi:GlsB/YeaQ/YmgE family stress response membrane protein [Streptomyces cinerochromogenes]|uniref:GlsB/YeaQ/YmgE family stress response membrane protein n=1 Tax=Streptomyces cinerochromogenes TaxID=66422 RepID=A0ABW7BEE3_9ACTN
MSFLWAIIAGLIIGLLAKLVIPGRQPIPLWLTVILGILGGVAGNALATAFGVRDTGGVDWLRHILQIGVAAVLISLVSPMWARRHA